jgi:hypothetical protein
LVERFHKTAVACLVFAAAVVSAVPAFAQIDLSGEWTPLFHEDNADRLAGPHIGDYAGIPLNDAARFMAQSWNADILSVPEHQCKPHPADYAIRGPADMRIWKEVEDSTQQVIALRMYIWWQAQHRTIWMDGRPHPDEFAPHTWQGFSTGSWEGPVLKVVTTHLKKGWIQRNGVPRSDQAQMTEYIYRRGEFLTWTVIIHDPLYLTEPMIRTTDFRTALTQDLEPYPCQIVAEVDKPQGWVPHWLPGENPFLEEFSKSEGLLPGALRGGAETLLPEYGTNVVDTALGAIAPDQSAAPDERTGSARAMATVDLTGYWVSLVTEDWRSRMKVPRKGSVEGIPATPIAIDLANAWDPAKDEARGDQCKGYGAAAILRVPTRIHLSWQDDNTLKLETDAGKQTRSFFFGPAARTPPGERSLVGFSVAEWDQPRDVGVASPGGTLKAVTANLRPGYLRKNGVPYGENAKVTEYFNRTPETYGVTYIIVTTIVEDPDYLFGPFVTSSHFRRLPDTANGWNPEPCSAR